MSRLFLRSQYNHVGLMLKYPRTGHIQIFESLRNHGVNKWNWSSFVQKKQYKGYHKIVYRKLNLFGGTKQFWDRESFDKNVFKFVVQTVGNPFKLGVEALSNTYDPMESDMKEEIPKDRGFFCSELIALLFKKLALLDSVKACNKYWPGDFSSENLPDPDSDNQIILLGEGNEFSQEYEIDFS